MYLRDYKFFPTCRFDEGDFCFVRNQGMCRLLLDIHLKDYCAFNKQNTLMQGDLPSVTERDFSILTSTAFTLASVMTAVSK